MKSIPAEFCILPMKEEDFKDMFEDPVFEYFPEPVEKRPSGWYCWEREYPEEGGLHYKPPYLVGEKCYVREAWRPERPIKGTYKGFLGTGYKDGAFKLTGWPSGFEAYPNGKWRSPVTMPQWAARSFVTVLSCEPVRVEDVTEEDAIKLGHINTPTKANKGMYHLGAKDKFLMAFREKHHGKEWAWRVESEEGK